MYRKCNPPLYVHIPSLTYTVHVRVYTFTHTHPPTHPHSRLSHSAVVARERGLPTRVGVSGGLMKRLTTGMKVHMDAGKGRVTIIREDKVQEDKVQEDKEETEE